MLQTIKQVQLSGTPFAVLLTQVPAQGAEAEEALSGFLAKGAHMFRTRLHYRKDFYRAPPLGLTAREMAPDSKAAEELLSAFEEAKRLSGYAFKRLSEVA